jgi:hypothetical protein
MIAWLVQCRRCLTCNMHAQLHEHDDAFVAVERADANGWCRIRRLGQEKIVYSAHFPHTVGDVDVTRLDNQKFYCPVWRDEDCDAAAGRGGGGGGLAARAHV